MKTEIRMTRKLYEEVLSDLRRPHPFALERVGFLVGRVATVSQGHVNVVLWRYQPILDEHYVDDRTVGASIGEPALSWAMQAAFDGNPKRDGIFHVHLHDHEGETRMSRTDERGLPPLMPGFRSVGENAAHGIVILSRDHGRGWVWLPGQKDSVEAERLVIVGAPMAIFERGRRW